MSKRKKDKKECEETEKNDTWKLLCHMSYDEWVLSDVIHPNWTWYSFSSLMSITTLVFDICFIEDKESNSGFSICSFTYVFNKLIWRTILNKNTNSIKISV